jgi:DNA topoisomerase-1
MILVIVESPSKCKKIESYLGHGYKCIASFGHIYHLNGLSSINMKTFEPKYELDIKKKKQTDFLKREIKDASTVILATDDDNAGHFIAWSICKEYGLSISTTKRILFHEITEKAILEAMQQHTTINMNNVLAEQTRQILDLIIGYNITPLLWKNISANQENSLSAGRCQSPALKLVWQNYKTSILNSNSSASEIAYKVQGYFSSKNIKYELNHEFTNKEDVLSFFNIETNSKHYYKREEPKKVYKKQPDPLTTSRLQQQASNESHLSPKETMKICQTLYEGGYITYMRTDCAKYSQDFLNKVQQYILENYLKTEYISPEIFKLENSVDTESAHEAIRPTNIFMRDLPEEADLTAKERRMYKLIWDTSLESCMSKAEYFSLYSTIQSKKDNENIPWIYKNTTELIHFLGWQIVKNKKDAKDSKEIKDYHYLLQLVQGSQIVYKKIMSVFSLKNEGQRHFTEARLIQLLEEKGIGRPSTYASIIDKIQERKYVIKEDIPGKEIECTNYELVDKTINEIKEKQTFGKEKGKLVIQPLGIMVMDFLDAHIDSLFDYEYTKIMEEKLDQICLGKLEWLNVCQDCLNDIQEQLSKLKKERKEQKDENKAGAIKIDKDNVFIIGKNGPVIKSKDEDGKVVFKSVKPDLDFSLLKEGKYNLEEIVQDKNDSNKYLIIGQYKDQDVIIKKGRYGLYATLKDTKENISLSKLGNRPIDNIKWQEVLLELEKERKPSSLIKEHVRKINENASIRNGQYGDYIFYKTDKMKTPKFIKLQGFKGDYKTCPISLLETWIQIHF